MGDGVVAVGVVAVVGGQHRGLDAPGDLQQLRVVLVLAGQPVVLQLHEQVVAAEDVLQPPGQHDGPLHVALQQRLEHDTAEAPGRGDHAVVMALEQLPVAVVHGEVADVGVIVLDLDVEDGPVIPVSSPHTGHRPAVFWPVCRE